MSKLYFAKYLPVDGEVRTSHGSTVSDNVGVCLRENDNGYDYYQKIKLFICTRDIKVNDEMTWVGKEILPYPEAKLPGIKFGEKSKCIRQVKLDERWIKVLDEVSQDAIWVKEGDEFSCEDLSANGVIQGTYKY